MTITKIQTYKNREISFNTVTAKFTTVDGMEATTLVGLKKKLDALPVFHSFNAIQYSEYGDEVIRVAVTGTKWNGKRGSNSRHTFVGINVATGQDIYINQYNLFADTPEMMERVLALQADRNATKERKKMEDKHLRELDNQESEMRLKVSPEDTSAALNVQKGENV